MKEMKLGQELPQFWGTNEKKIVMGHRRADVIHNDLIQKGLFINYGKSPQALNHDWKSNTTSTDK